MKISVELNEYYELLALHRAMMEAKFHEDSDSQTLAGSPYVANVANRVLEAVIEFDAQKKVDAREKWRRWRALSSERPEWAVAVKRARQTRLWNSWNLDAKAEVARILISPFQFSDEKVLDAFIREVDTAM